MVRHGPVGTPARFTTNGGGGECLVRLGGASGVWFDTTLRKTPGRLTTNGDATRVGDERWRVGDESWMRKGGLGTGCVTSITDRAL